MDLKGKTVVLLGATGGIGKELARELDSNKANLILVSKTESELVTLKKSLTGKDNKYYVCDLSNQEDTVKVSKKISQDNKSIDLLIAAAGIGIYKPIEEITLSDWNISMNICVTSILIFIKELQKSLNNSEKSLVLAIGSGMGVIPTPGRSVYCAEKFALRGLILSLAEEFKGTKTHFCLITLGSTLTSFGPMSYEEKKREMESGKAYFTPDWVAKKLVEIVDDDGRDIEYRLYPSDYGAS